MKDLYLNFEQVLDRLAEQLRGERAVWENSDPEIYRQCLGTIAQIFNRIVAMVRTTHYISQHQEDAWRYRVFGQR